jgi:hypothetical protein
MNSLSCLIWSKQLTCPAFNRTVFTIKKPNCQRSILRQLGRLLRRPAAFRPPLAKGLALSGWAFNQSVYQEMDHLSIKELDGIGRLEKLLAPQAYLLQRTNLYSQDNVSG